jgi:hypothetical protein
MKLITICLGLFWLNPIQAQLGSGISTGANPAGISQERNRPLNGQDPAGLETGTGTDLTPTQGPELPSGSVSSPLPRNDKIIFPEPEKQPEELDYSTLPNTSPQQKFSPAE